MMIINVGVWKVERDYYRFCTSVANHRMVLAMD
jgi:hypothetical protein